MYPRQTMPCHDSLSPVATRTTPNHRDAAGHFTCLIGLSLALLFALGPANGYAAAKAKTNAPAQQQEVAPQPVPDEVSTNEKGFEVPRKGPLISELREDLDPEVPGPETVIRRYEDYKGNTVREFLINGQLFQIEVIPTNGPPYYLIDVTGNGLFQERHVGYQPRLVVPQWVLFRF
ncbi:MAG: DUF2782 domain-containing protein [Magnetococcales bacterium]|nr:DUF2782 domain-containing protein [Magnetococcales bacterium]